MSLSRPYGNHIRNILCWGTAMCMSRRT